MLYFENDYCEGTHPAILQKLTETNFEKVSGYGTDPYCASAREKIRAACACPEADVQFISGGTQSNAIVIASMLQRWQGVVAAATGHVAGHEAGAIEYTGHKVITLPQHNGKLDAAELRALVATFYADDNHDQYQCEHHPAENQQQAPTARRGGAIGDLAGDVQPDAEGELGGLRRAQRQPEVQDLGDGYEIDPVGHVPVPTCPRPR